jgi:hypothetical protein
MGMIGLVTDNVYTPATLEKIKRITAAVEKIGGVESVKSLTNVLDVIPDLRGHGAITGVSELPLLIPRIPTDPAGLDALRRKVGGNPIYLNLVSRDGKGAAILIFFTQQIGEDDLFPETERRPPAGKSSIGSRDQRNCILRAHST